MAEVRNIFDEMLKYYPSMEYHLSKDGGIVHAPEFENAIVKVIEDELNTLNTREKELLGPLRKSNNAAVEFGHSPIIHGTQIAIQGLKKKKRKVQNEYIDMSFIPPTSNIVERLFSAARLVLTDYRKSMSPYTFECVMFLKVNRKLWDSSLVSSVVVKS